MRTRLSTALLATAAAFLPTVAMAGNTVPGPEIGGGYAGLAILAVVAGGALLFRRLRVRKA